MHYSRSQRRELARSLGMIGKKEPLAKWRDRIRRSQEAGRQIDRQFKNNVETNIRNAAAAAEVNRMSSLAETLGEDRANEIMANNRKLADARTAELALRKAKQKAKYSSK